MSINQLVSKMSVVVFVAYSWSADTGRIVGAVTLYPSSACERGGVVFAMTPDCRTSYRTTFDDRGKFAFDAIPSGTYDVMAGCQNAFSPPAQNIRVPPAETATLDLQVTAWRDESGHAMPPALPLNGRILDGAGRPIEGAIVTDTRKDPLVGGGASSVSGPDGRFGICEVVPGRIPLEVKRQGYRTRTIRLTLDDSKITPTEIKLRKR